MFEKFFYTTITIAASSLMAACSSTASEADELESGLEVRFTAADASRSALVKIDDLAKFEVYGNMVSSSSTTSTPSEVFKATPVTKTDGKWVYENTQYWMPGQTYSFVAISTPSTENITNLSYSADKLTFNYTAPADYTTVPDILTAAHRRKYEKPATPVAFNFGHIMARISFVAKVDPSIPNQTLSIDRIEVKGIASRATYSLQPAPLGTASQTSDFVAPTWTISGTPARISYTKNPGETITTGGSTELFPSNDALLIIPQNVTSDIEVELTYSRGGTPTTVSGRLRIASSTHGYAWAVGRSYSYSFTLGADDYLIFEEPAIKAWDEDEGGNYIVVD